MLSWYFKYGEKDMARLPRLYLEGCPQHIIQRGNNRQVCFFADEDYAFYLDRLHKAAEKSKALTPLIYDPIDISHKKRLVRAH
jgi:hypothetical protein